MSSYTDLKPPLVAHFVWHPNDHDRVYPLIEKFRKYLTRDIKKPFSRELNIPTFLYMSSDIRGVPSSIPWGSGLHNVVFLFVSHNMVSQDKKWKSYIDSIHKSLTIIPISIDRSGNKFNSLEGRLYHKHFIRAYSWPSVNWVERGILELSHELYRYGLNSDNCNEKDNGALKLFLSHAKCDKTGLRHAQSVKNYIDNSVMQHFFNTYDIAPAHRFDQAIVNNIKSSTLIAFSTDHYSSRYWCQREILTAKEEDRPILAVNCLECYEDRIFPAVSNVPCVHATAEGDLSEKEILNILIAALLETMRYRHAKELLKNYKMQNWIDNDAIILARPPEIEQILAIKDSLPGNLDRIHVCYPDPPLYREETAWAEKLNVDISTPLWSIRKEGNYTLGTSVSLSISEYPTPDYDENNLHADELQRFSQMLVQYLLARGSTLIYGGDLRNDGFTQFTLDEAAVLRDRLGTPNKKYVKSYLAWPLYLKSENTDWYANYADILDKEEVPLPEDIEDEGVSKEQYIDPRGTYNRYIWSRCLSRMREEVGEASKAHICAGGKPAGYLGKMPGVLEEFLIALKKMNPIYLVGGLGGITHIICQYLLQKTDVPKELTKDWQVEHTAGYADLLKFADSKGHGTDYSEILQTLKKTDLDELAAGAGLDTDQYKRLMQTPFVDEAVHLILEGLRKLQEEGK
jgi:hypothetical protein